MGSKKQVTLNMIKFLRHIVIILLLVQCKNKTEITTENEEHIKATFSKKQSIENIKDEKVLVSLNFNDRDDAYLIIRNQLKQDIIINRYLLGSSLVALDKEVDGRTEQINKIPLSVPPLNLSKYDTIITKNNQLSVYLYGLYILDELPDKETKIRACISYTLKNSKYEEACSDWMIYEKQDIF